MLSSSTNIQTLLQVCDYARIFSNPEFETRLRNLLNYSKQEFAPTDKFFELLCVFFVSEYEPDIDNVNISGTNVISEFK